MTDSRRSEPDVPEGFKTFLVNAARRDKSELDWMTRVLIEALKMEAAPLHETIPIKDAAEHALLALHHAGFELTLDESGLELKWVTT